jgi:hypothetical protein
MNHRGSTCRIQGTSVPAIAGTEPRFATICHEVAGVAAKVMEAVTEGSGVGPGLDQAPRPTGPTENQESFR